MRILLAATLLLALVATPAAAGSLAGVSMADSAKAGDATLMLNGMALRKKAIFKVYVAGLYLPAKSTDAAATLGRDEPRMLIMEFVRGVGKDSICEAWTEGLAANTPNASAELEKQFATLCSWMEDVENGESYVFTYEPGTGTTVRVKGNRKGTLEGKAFSDALMACFIGPKPGPGEGFKNDLMGK